MNNNDQAKITKSQIDKMQKLCYNLAHQISILNKADIQFIEYWLRDYVEAQQGYIPDVHLPTEEQSG